jgi:DNA sulfur modification protein DndB
MGHVEAARKHVHETLKFLKKMGFSDVDGGDNFVIGGRQIDACGGHENTLLIIECTRQKDIDKKINDFRGKLHDIAHGFRSHDKYKTYKNHVLVLAIKRQKVTQTHLNHAMKSKGRKVYLWDQNLISYYSKLEAVIGRFAKFNLLGEIDIKPEKSEQITTPAFQTRMGQKYILFLFFVGAKDLLKIAYVARRELGLESFYQRMIKRDRLRAIARYIEKGKVFPNSIVVALEPGAWRFEQIPEKTLADVPKWLEIGKLTLINNYRSCWIIDGQHRLYSYAHTNTPGLLAVSAFANIGRETQADYFLDINREAKPVDPNLLWDLLGSLSPNSTKGIISSAVKKLRDMRNGFFENNIRIPSIGKGKFNFNNICATIEKTELAEETLPSPKYQKIRNPFCHTNYSQFVTNLSGGLNEYFCSLGEGLQANKQQVFSDGFVSVMIRLFKLLVVHHQKRPGEGELKAFLAPVCEHIVSYNEEEVKGLRKYLTSEGNKKDFLDRLVKIEQERYDPHFAVGLVKMEKSLAERIRDLEFQLNEFINSTLEKAVGSDWMKEQKYFTDPAQRRECFTRAQVNKRPPWEFINFQTAVTTIIMNRELWQSVFERKFISPERFSTKEQLQMLTQELWNYRSNVLGHKRSAAIKYSNDKLNIIRSAYNIFLSIIEAEPE